MVHNVMHVGDKMFTAEDISRIDRTYFEVIRADARSVELKSKNTGHYWRVISEYDFAKHRYLCMIEHRHKSRYPYHKQTYGALTLSSAIRRIMLHDKFQLAGRDKDIYKKKHG